ncbi:MAG: Flagellar biosynthesis protein FlhA [Phycisphaerae bacterium]|nr:Flagellar biosynthesis protein FlhA [Phycisphaerae bacterium]
MVNIPAINAGPLANGLQLLQKHRNLLLPIGVLGLVFVVLVPLPTWALDFLLVLNITLSALILLTVMYVNSPLELSVFPSLLLGTALFRLVLNIASTRLILTNAEAGTAAAGRVIETFGKFVAGGSLAIGVVIFIIIVVIQFVVITKGATRIAEVAARFTLDGMPGKQMAVDADLNTGAITEEEARRRRKEITREADFYGAMDGASKFVRGDAIAGIIITMINILGGFYVGMVEVEPPYSFHDTLHIFTTLTIGDGLVSQIPAFIVSLAAAMIVSRSVSTSSFGEELLSQITSRPIALGLTGVFLATLLITPLPKLPLLLMISGMGGVTYFLRSGKVKQEQALKVKARAEKKPEEKPETLLTVDPMELEVGYGLVKLVDRKQGGDLLERIANIRRQQALELGILVPPVRIRDNIQLEPNQYAIKLRGVQVAKGETLPGHLLAIDSGMVSERIHGIETREPAFGLAALWITPDQRQIAEHRNYTVVESSSVLATHLTEVIKQYADELLTRDQVSRLIDSLKEKSPKLVEEVIPNVLKLGEVQKVLQLLLRERVPVRDLEVVLETLGDWASRTKDPEILTEYVRNSLARTICQLYMGRDLRISCVTLDPRLEDYINRHLDRTDRGTLLTMPPARQNKLVELIRNEVEKAMSGSPGRTIVLLCSPQVRGWVRRMIENALPQIAVLGFNEIVRGVELESKGMVVGSHEFEDLSS